MLVVGTAPLNVSNIRWLVPAGADTHTHYLGWAFLRLDDWHWPLGLNPNYGLQFSSSIFLSDSIPILALFFKSVSQWLPPIFQYSGWWLMSCFVLQAFFAFKLVSLISSSWSLRFFASIVFVFSTPMLWRLHGHFAMVAHWVILAALYLYLKAPDNDWKRHLAWMSLLVFSTMVHSYLLGIVFWIWIADLFQRRQIYGFDIRSKWLELTTIPVSILATLWAIGFFPITKSYLSGGYGIHRLNIAALFNPHGVSALGDSWSYLLPSIPQGYGDYEGFNFLGLGGLLALLIALPFLWSARHEILQMRYRPLIYTSLLLTLFAISNKVGFGGVTIEIWLPRFVTGVANIMRASGRFFWPVYYLIILGSIWLIARRFGDKSAAIMVAVFAMLQVVDTSSGWKGFRDKFDVNGQEWKTEYSDPDIDRLVAEYKKIRVLPASNGAKGWHEVAYLALRNGLGTDAVLLARAKDAAYFAVAQEAESRVSANKLEKDSVYILDAEFARMVSHSMNSDDGLFFVSDDKYIFAPNWGDLDISVDLKQPNFD